MRRALSTISSAVAAAAPRSGGITPDQRANVDRAFSVYTASLEEYAAKRDAEVVKGRKYYAASAVGAVATVLIAALEDHPSFALPFGAIITAWTFMMPGAASEAAGRRYQQRVDDATKLYELRKKHALMIEEEAPVEAKM